MPPYRLYDTPQRAKAQGAKEYCIAKGIPYDEREISAIFDLPERTGYRILAKGAPSRSTITSQGLAETRGRKTKLSGADVREANHLLEEPGLELSAKGMTWDADSPDLAPIENCWQGPKQYTRQRPHWDEASLMELLQEGWDAVSMVLRGKLGGSSEETWR